MTTYKKGITANINSKGSQGAPSVTPVDGRPPAEGRLFNPEPRKYGKNGDGREVVTRCVAGVGEHNNQCRHKRGWGPAGQFCKEHAVQMSVVRKWQ